GIERSSIPLLWTFRIVSQGEAVFDPANSVIPFPNNLLLGSNGKVNLPIPAGAPASQVQLITGLNTLDGFSTTAPIVSENSDSKGAIDIGAIDPATLSDGGVGFVKLNPLTGLQPTIKPCISCAS